MTETLIVNSPAKINLSLKVYNRMPSGLHGVCSEIRKLGFYDEIHLSKSDSDEFSVVFSDKLLAHQKPPQDFNDNNLVLRARDLLRPQGQNFSIKLVKRIPLGAGLGGGSSNAASVLKAINELCGMKKDEVELMELAATLGSDVAAFIPDGPVMVEGTGERITRLYSSLGLDGYVVKPPVSVATGEAYSWLGRGEYSGEAPEPPVRFENDFQPTVCRHVPLVAETSAFFADEKHILCGSGSAFFVWDVKEANPTELQERGWFVERCKTF